MVLWCGMVGWFAEEMKEGRIWRSGKDGEGNVSVRLVVRELVRDEDASGRFEDEVASPLLRSGLPLLLVFAD